MSEVRAMTLNNRAGPRFRASRVVGVVADANAAAQLRDALTDPTVELRIVDVNAANFSAATLADLEPSVIVVDADLSDGGGGASIETAVQAHAGGCPLIICTTDARPDAVRRIMRMGATEVLDANVVKGELFSTIERVLESCSTPHSARVTAFFSTRGGAGVSTMAVETAVAIAQRLPANSPGVCLVDLNLQFGVDAAMLNVAPALKPSSKLDPTEIDAQVLDAFLSAHKSRVQVLAPPPEWGQPNISTECIARLLDLAAERFAHVVIDLPKEFGTITEIVMSSADQFFVLTDMSVPGLQLTRSALVALDSRISGNCTVSVIVNRLSKWDKGVSLGAKDVHRLLPCNNIHFIYEDTETAAESSDRGEPIVAMRHDSRLAREIIEAVGAALPADYTQPPSKSPRVSGFLKLAKYR